MKYDPTKTLTLRNKFQRKLGARFKLLQKQIRELIVTQDVLGLKRNQLVLASRMVSNADVEPRAWSFLTDERKVEEFERWLGEQANLTIQPEGDVWEAFIQEGYKKGAGRAFDQVKKSGTREGNEEIFYQGQRSQFIGLNAPESKEKVQLLAQRVFTDLKGVTEVMATQIKKELLDGLVQGDNPNVIARKMAIRSSKGLSHAKRIARTEIIRAHAEGQLDALERLGVTEVGVQVEWSTAGDDRVCPICEPMNGEIFEIKKAHGLIPAHPNCRCAFMPALP